MTPPSKMGRTPWGFIWASYCVSCLLSLCAGMPTPEHGEQAGYLLASEPQDPHGLKRPLELSLAGFITGDNLKYLVASPVYQVSEVFL